MRNFVLCLMTLGMALGAPSVARADDAAACGNAFDQSQVKRDAGNLLDARNLFRVCQSPNCSRTQQKLCSEWLSDVEKRIPSFVLSAKDGSGGDLVDVKVTMDGVQVATRLDGRALEVDPGPHSFVFDLADGRSARTQAVADERRQGTLVSVAFPQPPLAPATPSIAPLPGTTPAPIAPMSEATTAGGRKSPLKTVGVVVGAVGLGGLALGTVFGIEALSTKSSHCASNGFCDPGSASDVYSQATISTVGFVGGGVLLAGGLTLFLVAPKSGSEATVTSVSVAPMMGSSVGGLQVAGRWW